MPVRICLFLPFSKKKYVLRDLRLAFRWVSKVVLQNLVNWLGLQDSIYLRIATGSCVEPHELLAKVFGVTCVLHAVIMRYLCFTIATFLALTTRGPVRAQAPCDEFFYLVQCVTVLPAIYVCLALILSPNRWLYAGSGVQPSVNTTDKHAARRLSGSHSATRPQTRCLSGCRFVAVWKITKLLLGLNSAAAAHRGSKHMLSINLCFLLQLTLHASRTLAKL